MPIGGEPDETMAHAGCAMRAWHSTQGNSRHQVNSGSSHWRDAFNPSFKTGCLPARARAKFQHDKGHDRSGADMPYPADMGSPTRILFRPHIYSLPLDGKLRTSRIVQLLVSAVLIYINHQLILIRCPSISLGRRPVWRPSIPVAKLCRQLKWRKSLNAMPEAEADQLCQTQKTSEKSRTPGLSVRPLSEESPYQRWRCQTQGSETREGCAFVRSGSEKTFFFEHWKRIRTNNGLDKDNVRRSAEGHLSSALFRMESRL